MSSIVSLVNSFLFRGGVADTDDKKTKLSLTLQAIMVNLLYNAQPECVIDFPADKKIKAVVSFFRCRRARASFLSDSIPFFFLLSIP